VIATPALRDAAVVNYIQDFLSEQAASRIGWGDARDNLSVVATVCKLCPEEILYYLENSHLYPKARLIQDIRQRHPTFEADTESLSGALACVELERRSMARDGFPSLQSTNAPLYLPMYSRDYDGCHGGILDWGHAEEEDCATIGEMTGMGIEWGPEVRIVHRREMPNGLLDPGRRTFPY